MNKDEATSAGKIIGQTLDDIVFAFNLEIALDDAFLPISCGDSRFSCFLVDEYQ